MQMDHRVPIINSTPMRQQDRKRSFSSGNSRKRDKHDLMCVVCHAPAMGYNFDQVTCESCKAFFRRNALNNQNKLKCRIGTNDCIITLETRKRCKYCRLKKCFDNGLRKEWILSEEEKLTKKQKIEDNRRLRAMSRSLTMLLTASCSSVTVPNEVYLPFSNIKSEQTFEDDSNDYKDLLNDENQRISLTKIEQHYTEAVRLNISIIKGCNSPGLRSLNGIIALINEPAQISSFRIITFFKLTPEFTALQEDDRLTLVKHNLLAQLYFHFCICTDIHTDIFHEPNTPNEYCYYARELVAYSDSIYHQALNLANEVQQICSYDHLIMKLLMLIMIFSKGADYIEPILVDPQKVFNAQNIFVDLLWNYFNVRFGDDQTASLFSRLIFSCMKTHSLARETKESIAEKNLPVDELAPLMQSLLHIS